MALHQAQQVGDSLRALEASLDTEVIKVTTAGDRWMGDLAELGGKGAFIKQIDTELLEHRADLAVHCLKDIPGEIPVPEGLAFAGYLRRDDIHDAAITTSGARLADLPEGSVIGTSSVRRTAQLRVHFPHLRVAPVRGNINTRLMRLDEGHFDGLVAAVAGMRRVGQAERITEVLPLETMCPPVGAGIIALQCREGDDYPLGLGGRLNHGETARQADAERAMLHALQGHCNSPIAGYATTGASGELTLRGEVFSPDASRWVRACHSGDPDNPHALGFFVGADLLRQGARTIIDAIPH